MIQIRHVPAKVHQRLKARAALAGVSLSNYVLAELRRSLEKPTRRELMTRLAAHQPVAFDVPLADVIRELRDEP